MADLLSPADLDEYTDSVRAYRNLRVLPRVVYSIKDRRANRLIAYTPAVTLRWHAFKIYPGEQRRARLRHERNVHAYVEGRIVPSSLEIDTAGQVWRRARYNVFKQDVFFDAETERPIETCSYVRLATSGMWYLT